MFLVPVGIYYGAPFGVGYYIWKSMIPAALGNIIGGVGFVGVSYWYVCICSSQSSPPLLGNLADSGLTGTCT